MDDKIDLEQQYQFYLKKMKLDEKTMNPIQRVETKRAFVGGFSQCWVAFSKLEFEHDHQYNECFEDLQNQLNAFWKKEVSTGTRF